MSYVCWVQNSLQSVNTGEDTLVLSGDTVPGGGGQSRRVWLVEAGQEAVADLEPKNELEKY